MPQLEQIDTFISQLFWLLVTFVPLYLILWKIALPRISATLESRQQRIDNDLSRADDLAEQAEEVLSAYEARLAEARSKAQEELHSAASQAAAEAEKRNAAMTEKMASEAEAARSRIAEARNTAISSVSDVARDLAAEITERLAGVHPDEASVATAIDAALKERG